MLVLLLLLLLRLWVWLGLAAAGRGGRELGGCAIVFGCVSAMVCYGMLILSIRVRYVELGGVGWMVYLSRRLYVASVSRRIRGKAGRGNEDDRVGNRQNGNLRII